MCAGLWEILFYCVAKCPIWKTHCSGLSVGVDLKLAIGRSPILGTTKHNFDSRKTFSIFRGRFEEILFPLRMFWWQRQWSQLAERDIFVPSRPSDVLIVKLTYHLADKLTKSDWKKSIYKSPFFPFPFCSAIGIRSPGSNYLHGKWCWVSEIIIWYLFHMEKDKEQDCAKVPALCELFQMSTLLLKLEPILPCIVYPPNIWRQVAKKMLKKPLDTTWYQLNM